MFSPAYQIVAADAGVLAVLNNPPRFFTFGQAPEGVTKPYAVEQSIGGSPENLLAGRPTEDVRVQQMDVYADSPRSAKEVTLALVQAFELHGYVTSWNFEGREIETKLYRISFTVEFITPR